MENWDSSATGWEGAEGVEFLMSDGKIVAGKFDMVDGGFDGERSYPIWRVDVANGRRMLFKGALPMVAEQYRELFSSRVFALAEMPPPWRRLA